jgi:hypothetical protein
MKPATLANLDALNEIEIQDLLAVHTKETPWIELLFKGA